MSDEPTRVEPGAAAGEAIAMRLAERRRNRLALGGAALLIYGLVGVLLFALLAALSGQPLERLTTLAATVEQQRTLAIEALDEAASTLSQTSAGVTNMDNSLARVQIVTAQAASISSGVGTSMHRLAEAMNVSVLGLQPFAAVGIGFENAAVELDQLSLDLGDVGGSLADNRRDAATVGSSLAGLSLSVTRLANAVRTTPSLEISGSIAALSVVLIAAAAWMMLLSLGCAAAGGWLLYVARRRS